MSVSHSNRVMTRILAAVGCLVVLMLTILLSRSCGSQNTHPDIILTGQPTEAYQEEETGYRLLSGSEAVILRLRRVGDAEIWEGTDADGAALMLVCDTAAREYHFTRDGVYLSRGSYRGRSTWDGGKTVFLLYENGIHNADTAGFRAVEYVALESSGDSGTENVSEMRFFLPDVWRAGASESTDGR